MNHPLTYYIEDFKLGAIVKWRPEFLDSLLPPKHPSMWADDEDEETLEKDFFFGSESFIIIHIHMDDWLRFKIRPLHGTRAYSFSYKLDHYTPLHIFPFYVVQDSIQEVGL